MAVYAPNFNGSVPTADAADNDTPADVLGNKTDTVGGDSLVSLVKVADAAIDAIDDSLYSATILLPSLAAGATVTAGAGAWDPYDAYVELDDGSNVPATDFVITGICIDSPSAGDLFQVSIGAGAGAAEVEVCEEPIEIATDAGFIPKIPTMSSVIAGGTRIAARIACAGAVARTLGIKVTMRAVA